MAVSTYNVLLIVIATISTLFTFVLLKLMSKQPFNGFAILIFSLAISTIIYDTSFYFHLQPANWGNGMATYIEMVGDLSMGIWTNIISITLIRIVFTLKNVHIAREFPVYMIANVSLVIGIVSYAAKMVGFDINIDSHAFRVYYITRTLQILLNVILYILTYIKVKLIAQDVQKGLITSVQAQNVTLLVGRMGYYAVIQILMRFFPTIYGADGNLQNNKTIRYLAVLTAPSCGVWFFFVYLHIQPLLWAEVYKYIYKIPLFGPWLRNYFANQQQQQRTKSVGHDDTWRITMEDIELPEISKNPLQLDMNPDLPSLDRDSSAVINA